MDPGGSDLPVGVLHWGLALAPIVLLLVLLAVRGWQAAEAGPVAVAVAVVAAVAAFRMPADALAVASGKGVWDAVFILYVIWPALLLYRVIDKAGGLRALRQYVTDFSENQLFLVLAFGWVFASFLQGITGFGAPIAVVAPLLVALGIRPVYAVAIPLIGHAWANMFGTLAVAWLAMLRVVEVQDPTATAVQTSLLLWLPNLAAGITIAWLFGRGPAVRAAWPVVVIVSAIHGGAQTALAFWNPVLANFIATFVAVVALYALSHWRRYSEPAKGIRHRPAMAEERLHPEKSEDVHVSLPASFLPYVVLTVLAVGTLVIGPLERALSSLEVGVAFPQATTGYGVTREAEDPYAPFAPLTHPGTFLLGAAVVAFVVYRAKGYYREHAERTGDDPRILPSVVDDAVPASIAVVMFLVLSTVMDHSGQTEVLALGIGRVAPAGVYLVVANAIGLLGSFMTSSNTASNILFSPLQQTIAASEGLAEASVLAAQGAGGAVGNAISPTNVVLGTGTAGIVGKEGEVLRITIPWAAAMAVGIGGTTLLLGSL